MFFRNAVKWSPVEVEYLRSHPEMAQDQLTIALAKSRNAIRVKRLELDGKLPQGSVAKHKRTNIGKRADLGLFLRSSWEANVARWLLHRSFTFSYEPEVFVFKGIKHGTVSYCPDFLVHASGEYGTLPFYLEVKGMLKNSDKTRIRRFQKMYPKEAEYLQGICNPNTAADKFFKSVNVPILAYYKDLDREFKSVIKGWE